MGLLAASSSCLAQSPPDNPQLYKDAWKTSKTADFGNAPCPPEPSSQLRGNTAKRGPAYLFIYGTDTLAEQSLDKSAEAVLIFEARITAGGSTRRADHSGAINNNDLRNV